MNDNTNVQNDAFDDLFLDSAPPVEKADVARLLKNYIRLYADTKEIVTTEQWESLNLQGKILTYMLGKKALRLRGVITEEDEKVSPSDIERETGLKGGSIRPTLSKLVDGRLIRIDKESNKYILPDYAVSKIGQIVAAE